MLLTRVMGVPPDSAADFRFTVQDVLDPPVNVAGVHNTEETPG